MLFEASGSGLFQLLPPSSSQGKGKGKGDAKTRAGFGIHQLIMVGISMLGRADS
jgi:hypothetical protein